MTMYKPVTDPQRGDRVTIEFTVPDEPFMIDERYADVVTIGRQSTTVSPASRLEALTIRGVREYRIKTERPVEVPTNPGAVVYPYKPELYSAYFLDEDGTWGQAAGGSRTPDDIVERLAAGTHYVAFEGVC